MLKLNYVLPFARAIAHTVGCITASTMAGLYGAFAGMASNGGHWQVMGLCLVGGALAIAMATWCFLGAGNGFALARTNWRKRNWPTVARRYSRA